MTHEVDPSGLAASIASRVKRSADKSVPALRRARRETSKTVRDWPAKSVVELAESLLERFDEVPRWLAYEIIHHHPAALESLNAAKLKRLGRGISSWAEVDAFACYLPGPAWRNGQVGDALIHGWARSKDRWWRRTALVSTVALNCTARGGAGDARRTLAVCDMLKGDRDDMVVKAMSWALRALAVKAPGDVRRYVEQHADTLHPRVTREVTNKLTTGLKNPKTRAAIIHCNRHPCTIYLAVEPSGLHGAQVPREKVNRRGRRGRRGTYAAGSDG